MSKPAAKLLRAAAAPSLERIRQDHRRTGGPVRPLLVHIGDNLFHPTLGLGQLEELSGLNKSQLNKLFHSAVGRPPYRYIENGRVETGCRLLVATQLKVFEIARLLGYSSADVFSNAFARKTGHSPTVYRRRQGLGAMFGRFSIDRLAQRAGLDEAELLERVVRGELEPELARALFARLRLLYPDTS